jgi:hypothetical protein
MVRLRQIAYARSRPAPDDSAFRRLVEPHREALLSRCYRDRVGEQRAAAGDEFAGEPRPEIEAEVERFSRAIEDADVSARVPTLRE